MPQLNPGPWFAILIFSWLVFLTVVPPKVMAHLFPSDPSMQNTEKSSTESWNWPWY
uniref:ATP synthase complex subunit 8 n=2 Tax=Lateolabrax TaxID=8163 RepID=A0A077LRW8_LATJA|nr:ATP synthase F0 subunit 8 [Lateolabrax maculatus]YP_009230386.1 ATP synthase F0 subunit 8 [Lateolabrax maculatus]YP_009646764.1 ATP synthase F0 subunit 8 [Lateolabrax japonicus]AFJ54014.1 ATP synthase F0 subunit 8 [Lateolabrax maculatus]AKJ83304.1 ATP synthase F0 subunit 8 [Lateolabrax maculatus]ALN11688.1 ATP synthase F0 subunit 8 [Lateolabrax japonicus]ALN11700.1 ATP synthase F0 subunit 8 [Lateolabrax maculatus]AMH85764.1 ATP synthase F0 subunit 8 [Lateolabrax maculatus]